MSRSLYRSSPGPWPPGMTLSFSAGDSMLITADVPTVSQITKASRMATYLSFVLYLDPALVADLSTEMKGRANRRRRSP